MLLSECCEGNKVEGPKTTSHGGWLWFDKLVSVSYS